MQKKIENSIIAVKKSLPITYNAKFFLTNCQT